MDYSINSSTENIIKCLFLYFIIIEACLGLLVNQVTLSLTVTVPEAAGDADVFEGLGHSHAQDEPSKLMVSKAKVQRQLRSHCHLCGAW